jgi:hypothetical protein
MTFVRQLHECADDKRESTTMQDLITNWRFWLFWFIAFLGFPIAGVLANLIGPVTTPTKAVLAGAVAGAALGLVQWLVLRTQLPLPFWWVVATSVGMAVGLTLGTVFLGSETGGNELLWRAAITGVCIGLAQWIVFQPVLPYSFIWIGVVGLSWVAGWFVTRAFGVDLSFKWTVFGSSGALTFQLITGIALYFLLRSAPGGK